MSETELPDLLHLGVAFDASSFDWALVKPHGIINRCAGPKASLSMTCGKILAHAKEKTTAFRENIGIRVCSFKIGVTSNPIIRFVEYKKKVTQPCGCFGCQIPRISSIC